MRMHFIWNRIFGALIYSLALATIGSLFAVQAWWLDILVDFKIQYVICSVFLLFLALVCRRFKETILVLVLLVINSLTVISHIDWSPKSRASMKVVSFNISNRNSEIAATLNFLRGESADVIVVTEVNKTWQSNLEQLLNIYPHQFYGPAYQGPGDEPHKIGLLAKQAWDEVGVEESDPLFRTFAVWARFPTATSGLTVAGVHLLNPVFNPAFYQEREIEALANAVKRFDGPIVLAGDFNMTPFSARYEMLLRKSGLKRASGGISSTWPAFLSPFGLSLDHILVGGSVNSASMRSGPHLDSDHLPIIGVFDLN